MKMHARLSTWLQLALAVVAFGVVSTARGQACETVTIEVLTDNFPGEIVGVDRDAGPNVDTESYNWGQNGQLFTYNYCLEDGCYTFTITDTFGDGICYGYGQGYYNIYVGGTLVATGGGYNYSESYTFCLELGDCFDPEACNFNPNAESANNDLCEYAIDSYCPGSTTATATVTSISTGTAFAMTWKFLDARAVGLQLRPSSHRPSGVGLAVHVSSQQRLDCDGNSLLPQFLTQPLDVTTSCESVPSVPSLATQPAPAAVAYQALFGELLRRQRDFGG